MSELKDDMAMLFREGSGDLVTLQRQVLSRLRCHGCKQAVIGLAPLLEKQSAIQETVREVVVELIKSYNARDYVTLENSIRQSIWSFGWQSETACKLEDTTLPAEAKVILLGINTLHRRSFT